MLLDVSAIGNRKVPRVFDNLGLAGDYIAVPGVSGKIITMVQLLLVFGGATTLVVKDGATALSGPFPFTTSMSMVLDLDFWYNTSPGNDLVFTFGSAVEVAGTIFYVVGKL